MNAMDNGAKAMLLLRCISPVVFLIHVWLSACLAVNRFEGVRCSREHMNSFAESLMPSQSGLGKSNFAIRTDSKICVSVSP